MRSSAAATSSAGRSRRRCSTALASLPNAYFVRGNGDREVLEGTDAYGIDWAAERARLGEERLAAVASWPLTLELDVDGLGRTLFCHAIPSADEPIFTRITPDEVVVELVGDVEAEVLVCGHTHVQFDRRLPTGLRVVNAGSVGMPYEGTARRVLGAARAVRRAAPHRVRRRGGGGGDPRGRKAERRAAGGLPARAARPRRGHGLLRVAARVASRRARRGAL